MQSLVTRSLNGCFLHRILLAAKASGDVVRLSRIQSVWGRVCLVVWLLSCCTMHSAELVSVPDPQVPPPAGGGGDSYMAFVTSDGRYVLFGSTANNLTASTVGGPYLLPLPQKINVFLRDRNMGTTALVSVNPSGSSGGDDDSIPRGISTNGQFALFEGGASNLMTGIFSTHKQVFLRDMASGKTSLVSVSTNSIAADGDSFDSVMTPDGRYVAFSSRADNLVSNDTNRITDVFVRDMQTGLITLVSAGARSNSMAISSGYGASSSDSPAITPDGRYVAFLSTASNLVPTVSTLGNVYVADLVNHTNFCISSGFIRFATIACSNQRISDDGQTITFQASAFNSSSGFIFRHHLQTGLDDIVSSNAAPPSGNYKDAQILDMTPDGRFVTFLGSTNSGTAVFIWDGQTATSSVVSVDTNGAVPATEACDFPTIDASGRFVTFLANPAGLVTNSVTSGTQHLYWRDLQSGITKLVDAGTNGTGPSRIFMGDYAMSLNGSCVAFDSPDGDLVANHNTHASDVYLRDLTAATTELISVHSPLLTSETTGLGADSKNLSISADGRYAAFSSTAVGLVPNYTNRYPGIFFRDLVNQTNVLVSADTNGLGNANGACIQPVISSDGQHVLFTSFANNLAPGDTNGLSDVFVRNVQTGTTTLVSANTNNTGSLAGVSSSQSISYDGRYVLYFNFHNLSSSVILRDCNLGTNYWVENGPFVSFAAMTPDGHYVAFYGTGPGGVQGIYVWDSQAAQMVYTNTTVSAGFISISTNGQWLAYGGLELIMTDRLANSNQTVSPFQSFFGARPGFRFSGDGRYLVYATTRPNTTADKNGTFDVYIYDWQSGSNQLVSQSFYSPQAPRGASDSPDISADGRFVVYESAAADIAPSDSNSVKDIFLYDRQTGITTLLSASGSGQGTASFESVNPRFTGNGQTVVFQSWAWDLTENDFNQGGDPFIVQIVSTNPISGSTNPPPVFAGELIYAPASGQGSPSLTWPVIPGAGYTVQFKDNLTDPNWQTVNGNVVIVGGQAAITDLAPNPTNRFYRIVAY